MKDIVNTPEIESVEPTLVTEKHTEIPEKKRLEMTKSGKLIFKIGAIILAITLFSLAATTFFSQSVVTNDDDKKSATVVGGVKLTEEASEEHKAAVAKTRDQQRQAAEDNSTAFIDDGVLDIDGLAPDLKPIESAPKLNGTEANTDTLQSQEQSPTPDQSGGLLSDADDGGKPSLNRNRNQNNSNNTQNGGSNTSYNEVRVEVISQLFADYTKPPEFKDRTIPEGTPFASAKVQALSQAFDDTPTTSDERGYDGQFSGEYDNALLHQEPIEQSRSGAPIGRGRGLILGDTLLAKVQNGLNSTTPSNIMVVEIVSPPLVGARLALAPELKYDNYVYSTDQINFEGHRGNIEAIVVTPNENLSTGYRSDVDYHTAYKLGMMAFAGLAAGAKTYVETLGGDVAFNDNTVIQSKKFNTNEALAVGAGSIIEYGQDYITQEINTPPTVTVDKGDLVGIMITADFNPEWFPFIPKHKKNYY